MLPTKVVVIGAGSASFGLSSLANLVSSERLRGSRLALVDRNAELVDSVGHLAQRLNREWDAQMTVTTHTHHAEALDGAKFVINSIEVPTGRSRSSTACASRIRRTADRALLPTPRATSVR